MRSIVEIQEELSCLQKKRDEFPEMKEWTQLEVDVLRWVLGDSRSETMWAAVK
jgi:hypothetical protein